MNNVLGVERVESEQDLLEDVGANSLRVIGLQVGDDGRHRILHKFDEDPETAPKFVLIEDLEDNLIVLKLVHQRYFIPHHNFLFVSLSFDELESTGKLVCAAHDSENFGKATDPQLVLRRDVVLV